MFVSTFNEEILQEETSVEFVYAMELPQIMLKLCRIRLCKSQTSMKFSLILFLEYTGDGFFLTECF